jgi:hypothetical protein
MLYSSSLYNIGTDRIENSVSNSSSVIACVFVAVRTCLFAKALLSNGSCIFGYLAVVAQQRAYMLQYTRLLVNSSDRFVLDTGKYMKREMIMDIFVY